MSQLLLDNVIEQFIDQYGKVQILYYKNLCIITSPLPPIISKDNIISERKDIVYTDINNALSFIGVKSLSIKAQYRPVNSDKIKGIWVEGQGIFNSYIPVNDTDVMKNIQETTLYPPLITFKSSSLKKMYMSRKIADYIKQYTLFEYSRLDGKLTKDNFVVVPDHVYDIDKLNKKFIYNNHVMYKDNRLIVTSEEMINRLLSFLKVQVFNDKEGVLKYKNKIFIKNYYKTLSDFRQIPNQIIFLNKESLQKWYIQKKELTHNIVTSKFLPNFKDPYFYRNYNVNNDKLSIIQNVKDHSLKRALTLGEEWIKNKINLGYDVIESDVIESDVIESDNTSISYIMWNEYGEIERTEKGKEYVHIVKYSDNRYAALLPLE